MLVPRLRFKEFKDEYNTYKLNDIVDFYKGNSLSKSDIKKTVNFLVFYMESCIHSIMK